MRRTVPIAILLAAAACTAPSDHLVATPGSERDCFNVGVVTGYDSVDRDTVRLQAGPSTEYDVDLSGGQCNNLDWAHRLAIESTPSSWICVGSQPGQGNISFRDPATNRRVSCYIGNVRRVPAQASEQK